MNNKTMIYMVILQKKPDYVKYLEYYVLKTLTVIYNILVFRELKKNIRGEYLFVYIWKPVLLAVVFVVYIFKFVYIIVVYIFKLRLHI